jgi:POT family proton-dependent oligopeptide transporter
VGAVQIMGLWFMATALGNLVAGLIAGEGSGSADQMASHFWWVALSATGIAIFPLVLSRPMRRWMAGVK